MIKFIKQKLPFEKSLKQRLDFTQNKNNIINGNIIKMNKTNLAYIEPHKKEAKINEHIILFLISWK